MEKDEEKKKTMTKLMRGKKAFSQLKALLDEVN
jgi:hypothetical protein